MTRVTLYWVAVGLVLFPVLALLGLVMRTLQAGFFPATPPEWFYAVMTLHGLGMVGVWFVAGLAAMSFLLTRVRAPEPDGLLDRARHDRRRRRDAGGGDARGKLGVGGTSSTRCPSSRRARGPTGPPRPSSARSRCWGGVDGLVGDVLRAIAGRYRLSEALGWHYLSGRDGPEVPPIVIIATVSCIGVLAGLVAAVVIPAPRRLGGARGRAANTRC